MLHVFVTNIMRCQLVESQDSWQFIIIFWMAWNLTGQGSWQFIYYMFKIHTFCIDPLIRHMKYIFIYIYIYISWGLLPLSNDYLKVPPKFSRSSKMICMRFSFYLSDLESRKGEMKINH